MFDVECIGVILLQDPAGDIAQEEHSDRSECLTSNIQAFFCGIEPSSLMLVTDGITILRRLSEKKNISDDSKSFWQLSSPRGRT